MNGFKHGILLANVCTASSTYAALKFCSFVGDNVAVKIGENKYLEILAALRVDELGRCDVDVPLVGCDLGIILADILAKVEKLAVGGLDDVSLGDDGNSVLMISSCIVVSELCDSLTALRCGYNKVNSEIVRYVNSL